MTIRHLPVLSSALGLLALGAVDAGAVTISPNGTSGAPVTATITNIATTDLGNPLPNGIASSGLEGQQSLYNQAFLTQNCGNSGCTTTDSASAALGSIPVVFRPLGQATTDPGGYFEFAVDFNENNSENPVDGITSFQLTVARGSTIVDVFLIDEPLTVVNNAGQQQGNTLLGTESDIAIYVPVRTFVQAAAGSNGGNNGLTEFIGTDILTLTSTVINESGGPDQWLLRTCTNTNINQNIVEGGCFGDDVIMELPIPGALPLMLTGIAGLGWVGWRRRSAA